jgi:hypothetical protein
MSLADASGPEPARFDIAAVRGALTRQGEARGSARGARLAAMGARAGGLAERVARRLLESALVRRTGAGAAALLGLWLGYSSPAPAPVAEPAFGEAASTWLDIVKPFQLYEVAASEFEDSWGLYEAQHNLQGGGRRDTLSFGALDKNEAYLRVSFYRIGREDAAEPTMWVEMARRAAGAGLSVDRASAPTLLPTRFGSFEASDLTMSGAAGVRLCIGFRLSEQSPRLRISGFACGEQGRAFDRSALACVIDRFDLVAAGEDSQLRAFFARAEQDRRQECFPRSMAQNANWLAPQSAAPALRSTPKDPPKPARPQAQARERPRG